MRFILDVFNIVCPHCNDNTRVEFDFSKTIETNNISIEAAKANKICNQCRYEFTIEFTVKIDIDK